MPRTTSGPLRSIISVLTRNAGRCSTLLFVLCNQMFALQSSGPVTINNGTDIGGSPVWVFANLSFAGCAHNDALQSDLPL